MSYVLGLDVGASAIKAVLLEPSLFRQRIHRLYHYPYGEKSRSEAIQSFFSEVLEEKWERLVVSLKGYEGSVRVVDLPFKKASQVSGVLSNYLETEYADGTENKLFRFHRIFSDQEAQSSSWLSIGVEKESVDGYLEDLKKSGLKPWILDYDAYANFNCFCHSSKDKNNQIQILLDIGARSTAINILGGEELLYTRSVFYGGNDFTAAIARELNMEFVKAEELKIEYGARGFAQGGEESRIDKVLAGCMDRLVREIRLTLGAFSMKQGDCVIQKISLFGGGALLQGLCEYIRMMLEIPVEHGNPVREMSLDLPPKTSPLLFSIAIGLALRGVEQGKIQHNFLQRKIFVDRYSMKISAMHLGVVSFCFFVWLFFLVGKNSWLFYRNLGLSRQYTSLEDTILKKQRDNFQSMRVLREKISERKKLLERFSRAQKSPLSLLSWLSVKLTIKDVYLEQVVLVNDEKNTQIILKGDCQDVVSLETLEKVLASFEPKKGFSRKSQGQDRDGRTTFEHVVEL